MRIQLIMLATTKGPKPEPQMAGSGGRVIEEGQPAHPLPFPPARRSGGECCISPARSGGTDPLPLKSLLAF